MKILSVAYTNFSESDNSYGEIVLDDTESLEQTDLALMICKRVAGEVLVTQMDFKTHDQALVLTVDTEEYKMTSVSIIERCGLVQTTLRSYRKK